MTRRNTSASTSMVSRFATGVAKAWADCSYANQRMVELQLNATHRRAR